MIRHWLMPDGLVGFPVPIDGISAQAIDSPYYSGVWASPGVYGVSLPFPWCGIERAPGSFSFAELDAAVSYCVSRRLKVLLRPMTIRYSGGRCFLPDDLLVGQQARDHGGWAPNYSSVSIWRRWRSFVAALAAHYGDVYGVQLEETNWADFATKNPGAFAAIGGPEGERMRCQMMLAHAQGLIGSGRAFQGHNYFSGNPPDSEHDKYMAYVLGAGLSYMVNDLLPADGPAGYQSPPFQRGYLPSGRETMSMIDTASWANQFTAANAQRFVACAQSNEIENLVWNVIGGASGACWGSIRTVIA